MALTCELIRDEERTYMTTVLAGLLARHGLRTVVQALQRHANSEMRLNVSSDVGKALHWLNAVEAFEDLAKILPGDL